MELDYALQGVDRAVAIGRKQRLILSMINLPSCIVFSQLLFKVLLVLSSLLPDGTAFFLKHPLWFALVACLMSLPLSLWITRSKALEDWTTALATVLIDLRNRRRVEALKESGVIIRRPELVWIGTNVSIAPGAQLCGPAVIEDRVSISSSTRIGPHARLWGGTVLKGACVLDEEVSICGNATVTDSLLGKDVRVTDGASVTGCTVGDGGRIWTKRPIANQILAAGEVIEDLPDASGTRVRTLADEPPPTEPSPAAPMQGVEPAERAVPPAAVRPGS